MNVIETSIQINAPAHLIWKILTKYSTYNQWNPLVKSLEGLPDYPQNPIGTSISIQLSLNNRTMKLKPRVTQFKRWEIFEWTGHLIIPGIFDGTHQFLLKPMNDHQVIFTHREEFSGVLVKPALFFIKESTEQMFQKFNEALKSRAEQFHDCGCEA